MRDIFAYASYAFVFGHPDDEMFMATVIKQVVDAGKRVHLIYLTSGDYRGKEISYLREQEARHASSLLGVHSADLHMLRHPETTLHKVIGDALQTVVNKVQELQPECIITHDYEGGNSVHDYTVFCATQAAKIAEVDVWAFPAYHKQPHERLWNQFVPDRRVDFELELTDEQVRMKYEVFAAHATEKLFFEKVLASTSSSAFTSRELLRFIDEDIDFTKRPTKPVGYDFRGSPTKYRQFKKAVKKVNTVQRRPWVRKHILR